MTHSFPTRLSSDLHELAVVEAETVVAGRGEAEVVVRPVTDIQHHLGAKCGGHAGRGLDCETPILADAPGCRRSAPWARLSTEKAYAPMGRSYEIGSAQGCTPVTNAHIV